MGGPMLLRYLTDDGSNIEGWRTMPLIYGAALVVMSVLFFLFTENRVPEHGKDRSLKESLKPLANMRVWMFRYYYFLVFGAFVALSQWLIPYYLNVYAVSLATAGLLAAIFSLPSGLIRALGGYLSDRFGARSVMYWVLGTCTLGCLALIVPRMDISSPGEGIMAAGKGVVSAVTSEEVIVGDKHYKLESKLQSGTPIPEGDDGHMLILPTMRFWQEPVVSVGQSVVKKQILARGTTHIYFQANIWIFTFLVFVVGIAMGIGKAAVYKHIPEYFPKDVGGVGGLVGVIGGLGGFFCPIWFGIMLHHTGLWTTTWMVLFAVSLTCLLWMHWVIRKMLAAKMPEVASHIDSR